MSSLEGGVPVRRAMSSTTGQHEGGDPDVVHDARQETHRGHHHRDEAADAIARCRQHPLADEMSHPGPHERAAQDQDRSDRDDRFVGEAHDRRLAIEDARHDESEHHHQRDEIHPDLLGDEQDHRDQQDPPDDEHLEVHSATDLSRVPETG